MPKDSRILLVKQFLDSVSCANGVQDLETLTKTFLKELHADHMVLMFLEGRAAGNYYDMSASSDQAWPHDLWPVVPDDAMRPGFIASIKEQTKKTNGLPFNWTDAERGFDGSPASAASATDGYIIPLESYDGELTIACFAGYGDLDDTLAGILHTVAISTHKHICRVMEQLQRLEGIH